MDQRKDRRQTDWIVALTGVRKREIRCERGGGDPKIVGAGQLLFVPQLRSDPGVLPGRRLIHYQQIEAGQHRRTRRVMKIPQPLHEVQFEITAMVHWFECASSSIR